MFSLDSTVAMFKKVCSTETNLKHVEPSYQPELPSEVWEHIFWKLQVKHLLAVRETCHQFKFIVDHSPSLMRQILVRVPGSACAGSERFRAVLQLKNLTSLDVRKITINDEDLHNIAGKLPKLKSLALTVGQSGTPYEPTFLDTIPKLENVALWGMDCTSGNLNVAPEKQKIDFSNIKNNSLTRLQFAEMSIARNDLQEYFKQCSQLREVNFFGCHFDSWIDILEVTGSIKSLERLSISVCRGTNNEYSGKVNAKFENLRHLRFVGGNISKDSFKALLEICPNLVQVSLMFAREFLDDSGMLVLGQNVKKLKFLSIYDCHITDAAMETIQEHCKSLKMLRIDSCYNVSTEAKNMLQNAGIEICTYISPYSAVQLNKL